MQASRTSLRLYVVEVQLCQHTAGYATTTQHKHPAETSAFLRVMFLTSLGVVVRAPPHVADTVLDCCPPCSLK